MTDKPRKDHMRFQYELIVPAGTPEASPVTQDVNLVQGVLIACQIWFRPGPIGLVEVAVKDGPVQIVPLNPEGSIAYNDFVDRIPMDYLLNAKPYRLTLVGWSPTAVFPHTVTFGFDVRLDDTKTRAALQTLLEAFPLARRA